MVRAQTKSYNFTELIDMHGVVSVLENSSVKEALVVKERPEDGASGDLCCSRGLYPLVVHANDTVHAE